MKTKWIKLFLRLALSFGFLSAVADRLGWWPKEVSAWGDFDSFLSYTASLVPWAPSNFIPFIGSCVTILEAILGLFLLLGFKTKLTAQVSGFLLLIFAFSMTLTSGIKGPLDYSVFSAAAAAFGLSLIKEQFLEVDALIEE
jgi:thiosulfate dehydrogenase (quinone) large subunit